MPEPADVGEYVEELNEFYTRFDVGDHQSECDAMLREVNKKTSATIVMSNSDVLAALKKAKPGKSCGPDKISANVVKHCRYELLSPMQTLFQRSLDECTVPLLWKTSEVVPVPKVKLPQVKNDLRPVALTSVLMKCLETFVKQYLCKEIGHLCDKFQFAYRKGRSVDDAVLTLLHSISSHLDKTKTYSRLLFVDFSSAFHTIKPHILLKKLYEMEVNCKLIRWIHSYLTNRPQYVKLGCVKSGHVVTNTGAPQGCVLSPILFTLYTNDCISFSEECVLLKYADDTVIIGNITDDNTSSYRCQVDSFVKWCDTNFLNLNVKKTKELIVDFRKNNDVHEPLIIKDEIVQTVNSYKYLGVFIDDKLSFTENVQYLYNRCSRRMCYLRQLADIKVTTEILGLFYKSIIESTLSFCIAAWFASASKKDQRKLHKIVRFARRLGVNPDCLLTLNHGKLYNMASKIVEDPQHPLHHCYQLLRSGKRFSAPKQRTSRFSNSFVPTSIKYLNNVKTK